MSAVDAVLAGAVAAYRRRLGRRPTFAAGAPGRVNLIGEHTDYTGGLALPMAIDRRCVAVGGPAIPALARSAPGSLLLAAELDELVAISRAVPAAQAAASLPEGHWARYVAGVLAEFEEAGYSVPPIDIAVAGNVPIGAGLSSSAALEVAVATLLEQAAGVSLDPLEKARLCQRAEHRWAGVRCGLMDQFAAVAGREGHALLMDFSVPSAEPVPIPSGIAFLVADTRVRHTLAASVYGDLVDACERARGALGVASLRDATPEMVERQMASLDLDLYRAARHVVTENARVVEAAAALRSGELARFGRLMLESHRSLQTYGVSCAELDAMVEILVGDVDRPAPGVFGARMTGAGFGGCVVAAVTPEAAPGVAERTRAEYRVRCGRACDVFLVRAAGGAGPLGM